MRTSSPGGIALAATAAAVLAIWLVGVFLPAYTSLDPPRWLPFPSDAGSWTRTGAPDAATFGDDVTLRSSAFGTNHLYHDLPLARPAGEDTRLQLTGRVIEERREGRSWATGEVRLAFKAASGQRLRYVELRQVPRRATDGDRFSTVVEWPAEAASVELSLHSEAGAPTFSLAAGSAEFVRPDPLYRVALAGLVGVALVWAWTIVRFARPRGALRALLVPGALAFAILLGVTLSMRELRPRLVPLQAFLEAGYGIEREITTAVLLKGGHALGFFLLTLGLLGLRRHLGVGRAPLIAFAALIAIGSEGVQSHLADRGASALDVLIDLGGVFAAWLLVRLVRGRDPGRRRRGGSTRRRASSTPAGAPHDGGRRRRTRRRRSGSVSG